MAYILLYIYIHTYIYIYIFIYIYIYIHTYIYIYIIYIVYIIYIEKEIYIGQSFKEVNLGDNIKNYLTLVVKVVSLKSITKRQIIWH